MSRRRIPLSNRLLSVLDMRRDDATSEWVYPVDTKSGHIESSTLKKQHAAALALLKVPSFVMYTFRHTCITRWARHIDPYVLHVLARTHQYEHYEAVRMAKVQGGHSSRHSDKNAESDKPGVFPVMNWFYWSCFGATRRSRTGDPLITNQSRDRN